MKPYLILAALAFAPAVVSAQYNIQAATVSPTPARATTTPASSVASPTPSPEEASVDYYLKIDGVEGESEKKGNVEYEWKVEEGESSMDDPDITTGEDGSMEGKESGEKAGTGDINIGVGENRAAVDSFFDIWVDVSTDGEGDPDRPVVAGILLEGLQEDGIPVEEVTFNFEKIQMSVNQDVKLLGFIPVSTTAEIEVDTEGDVKVRFPWWSFLARGIDSDDLGDRVLGSLANVIRAHHDTMMQSIRNMK